MEWDLPDHRLGIRAQLCMDRIRSNPDLSFPDIFTEPKELLGFYRFINNSHVDYNSLGATYFDKTKKQCQNKKDILVLHDTTIVQPTRTSNGLRPVYKSKDSKGFLCHLSLAVASQGQRVIMGPSGIYNWTRKKIKASNEHLRWFEQVKNSEECFVAKQVIHIMDREGDSFYNLHHLNKAGYRFVVRSCHDRLVPSGQKMLELITSTQVIANKTVTINQRPDSELEKKRWIHPPRETRTAKLSISAQALEIVNSRRTKDINCLPATTSVNMVRVFEQDPPSDERPIQWILFTSEPIKTNDDVLSIVEAYKRRWLIEEFFKVLKTGCRLEERLITSEETWYNVITLLLEVATSILNLRVSDNKNLTTKNPEPFSVSEYKILKQMAKKYRLPLITTNDAMMVIAKMGGHIINKKYSPGWLVLCRGYEKLLYMAIGYSLGHS